jgi:hypothetical protein
MKFGQTNLAPLKNVASGAEGYWFKRAVIIDQKPWFEEWRRSAGNFRFGLQSIRSDEVIQGLEDLAASNGIRRRTSPQPLEWLLIGTARLLGFELVFSGRAPSLKGIPGFGFSDFSPIDS